MTIPNTIRSSRSIVRLACTYIIIEHIYIYYVKVCVCVCVCFCCIVCVVYIYIYVGDLGYMTLLLSHTTRAADDSSRPSVVRKSAFAGKYTHEAYLCILKTCVYMSKWRTMTIIIINIYMYITDMRIGRYGLGIPIISGYSVVQVKELCWRIYIYI